MSSLLVGDGLNDSKKVEDIVGSNKESKVEDNKAGDESLSDSKTSTVPPLLVPGPVQSPSDLKPLTGESNESIGLKVPNSFSYFYEVPYNFISFFCYRYYHLSSTL